MILCKKNKTKGTPTITTSLDMTKKNKSNVFEFSNGEGIIKHGVSHQHRSHQHSSKFWVDFLTRDPPQYSIHHESSMESLATIFQNVPHLQAWTFESKSSSTKSNANWLPLGCVRECNFSPLSNISKRDVGCVSQFLYYLMNSERSFFFPLHPLFFLSFSFLFFLFVLLSTFAWFWIYHFKLFWIIFCKVIGISNKYPDI